jgi:hypothetical protein
LDRYALDDKEEKDFLKFEEGEIEREAEAAVVGAVQVQVESS